MAHWSLDLLAQEPGTFGEGGGFGAMETWPISAAAMSLGFGKLLRAVQICLASIPLNPHLFKHLMLHLF